MTYRKGPNGVHQSSRVDKINDGIVVNGMGIEYGV